MHDNGKQVTSMMFKHFLEHNNIRDKPIPNSYPQLQGKVEAYNKIVKNEFLAVEQISSIDEGKVRYDLMKSSLTSQVKLFLPLAVLIKGKSLVYCVCKFLEVQMLTRA